MVKKINSTRSANIEKTSNEKLSRSFSVPNSFLCFIWIKAHSDMLLDNLLEPQYGWGKVGRTKVGRTIDTRTKDWKSKIKLQRNGMAAIPKSYKMYFSHNAFIDPKFKSCKHFFS